jgi:hypothetical protein
MFYDIKQYHNFLLEFLKDKDYIYVTTITKEYVDMAYNWFLSLKKCNQDDLVLIVTIDDETCSKIKSLGINSINIGINLTENNTKSQWIENEKKIKLIAPFYIVETFKKPIIHSDVDIFFNKNPYPIIEKHKEQYDLILMSDKRFDPFLPNRKLGVQSLLSVNKKQIDYCQPTAQQKFGEENAGFSFININKKNYKKYYDCFNVFLNQNFMNNFSLGNEETNFQSLTNKRIKEYDFKIKKLNCFDFVNGSIWKIPYINKQIKDSCYLVHYNFCEPFDMNPIESKLKKIEWMKQNNHWLL